MRATSRIPPRRAAGLTSGIALALLGGCLLWPGGQNDPRRHMNLVIVLEGLRPGDVSPELTPRMAELVRRGTFAEEHRDAYPPETHVGAACLGTGSYPARHGILGSRLFLPEIGGPAIDAADATALERLDRSMGEDLVTAPTLAEVLAAAGRRLVVVSSGDPGSALLLDPRFRGAGTFQTELIRPEGHLPRLLETFGATPAEAVPNVARDRRAVDILLGYVLPRLEPHVVFLWLSEPGHTARATALRPEPVRRALAHVDAEIGRLLDGLRRQGRLGRTNVFILSSGAWDARPLEQALSRELIERGWKAAEGSPDVVIAGGGIHLRGAETRAVREIARSLLASRPDEVILTRQPRPTHPEGFVPGTLSLEVMRLDHARAPEAWVGPKDFDGVFLAAGPDIKKGLRNPLPTSVVDLAPTLCRLNGLSVPSMDGRLLEEMLRGGPNPSRVRPLRRTLRAAAASPGVPSWDLEEIAVGGHDYPHHLYRR